MAKRKKAEGLGKFLSNLEKYNPMYERDKHEKAAVETFFIGMPARGEAEDQLFVVMNIGTINEKFAQIKINDIERIIELPNRDHPGTLEPVRQVKVIVKPGAFFFVSYCGRANAAEWPRIRPMPRSMLNYDIDSRGCGGGCHCKTQCSCGCACFDRTSSYSALGRTENNNSFCDTASDFDSTYLDNPHII